MNINDITPETAALLIRDIEADDSLSPEDKPRMISVLRGIADRNLPIMHVYGLSATMLMEHIGEHRLAPPLNPVFLRLLGDLFAAAAHAEHSTDSVQWDKHLAAIGKSLCYPPSSPGSSGEYDRLYEALEVEVATCNDGEDDEPESRGHGNLGGEG